MKNYKVEIFIDGEKDMVQCTDERYETWRLRSAMPLEKRFKSQNEIRAFFEAVNYAALEGV